MTQVTKVEPEALSKSDFGSHEAWCVPAIGTPEHAKLVDAIKQNFPEIYQDPNDSERIEPYRGPPDWSSPLHLSPCT
jgi:hypothetical protein